MKRGIIIGAGIGGLTTSIALAKQGIQTEIYEQANLLGEVGAGIWVAPNGLKVYNKLGIADEIIKAGNILEKISVVDLNYKTISVINSTEVYKRHGFKTVAIHRADLHKILVSKLNKQFIHLGKRLKSISQDDNGVSALFEDGTHANADFVICADGIKSVGRSVIQPNIKLRYSGQTCWRFVTDYDFEKGENDKMYEIWSNKKGLRVGYSKINSKQVYVFITNFEKAGNTDNKSTVKNDLLQMCDEFPVIVKNLISSCNPSSILRSDLYDFPPIKSWVKGNIALLGDAAHATTPNLGQGACQAIEDAWVVSKVLSNSESVKDAFIEYEKLRLPKATFITKTSYSFAKITNMSGLGKSIVKSIIRLTPDSINNKQLDKIYNIVE